LFSLFNLVIFHYFRSPTATKFSEEDEEFLKSFDSNEAGLGGFRNHLHLATAISPLALLLPHDIAKKSFNRQVLIEVIVYNLIKRSTY
jgi:hypothetical protein